MVKAAMIGTGGYAYALIDLILKIPDKAELVAVYTHSQNSIGVKLCQERNIPVYMEIDDFLDDMQQKADVIMIPTPINTHFALAKKCLEAGFEVLLEKPPVATIQQHDELLEISRVRGKQVPVMFQCMYSRILPHLQKRIISGEFGKLRCIKGIAGWMRPDSYFTRSVWAGRLKVGDNWVLDGTINNPLAHMLCNQLFLASDKPGQLAHLKTVQAELYHAHEIESEDTSSVRIVTSNDVEILFNTSLCTTNSISADNTIECDEATIEFVNFTNATITYKDGRSSEVIDDDNESHHRLPMLVEIFKTYETGNSYAGSLEVCRPFTLAVNGAFESCGRPHTIGNEHIIKTNKNHIPITAIKGIEGLLRKAHLEGRMFSEVEVHWTKNSDLFRMQDYKEFSEFVR